MRRTAALVSLAVHASAAIALPPLHLAGGRAHRHVAGATLWDPLLVEQRGDDLEAHHARFAADLAALDLSEAAHFGVASVDCSLAEYTQVECDDPAAPPHSFGDELEQRLHRHLHRDPFDPRHGAGALEHLGWALARPALLLLPPPSLRVAPRRAPLPLRTPASRPAIACRARGPPPGAARLT
jgi:hypothetical protein